MDPEFPTSNSPTNPNVSPPQRPLADDRSGSGGPGAAPHTVVFRILFSLVLVGLFGVIGGRLIWRHLRLNRARDQASQAEKLMREQKPLAAQPLVRAAYMIAPNDPAILRAAARWSSLVLRPEGLSYWDRLAALGPLTRVEQILQVDLALALNRVDLSRELLKKLVPGNEKDRAVLLRALRYQQQVGSQAKAEAGGKLALISHPTDPEIQFTVGRLYLESSSPPVRMDGRRLLWDVALGQSEWRDAAVDLLSQSQLLDTGDRALLVRTLAARQPDTLANQLQILSLRAASAMGDRELAKLADEAEQLSEKFPTVSDRVNVARWLARSGATNRALAYLPLETVGTNATAAADCLDLLLRARAWPEAAAMLDRKPLALPDATQQAALGLIDASTTRLDPQGRFAQALRLAAGQPSVLFTVATYAEAGEEFTVACDALLQHAELNPMVTLQSCRRALGLAQRNGDLDAARRSIERLGSYLPGEEVVLLERSWLDLLFRKEVPRAQVALNHLLAHPKFGTSAQVAMALAELRSGQAVAAMTRVENSGWDYTTLPPRHRATIAAVLEANGQREPARRLALTIPEGQLHGPELELVKGLR